MAKGSTISIDLDALIAQLGPQVTRKELQRVLNVKEPDLNARLADVANAALAEMLEMIAVQPMSRNAQELRQFRLFYLMKFALRDRQPREGEIAQLFRIRHGEARRLIDDTRLRFGPALWRSFYESVVQALQKNKPKEGTQADVQFESVGGDIFEAVSQYALERFPSKKQPYQVPNAGAVYAVPYEMYDDIVKHFQELAAP